MAEDLDAEFQVLNKAVKARDEVTYAKWDREFTAWMSGDRSGLCPFETEDSLQRTCIFSSRVLHIANSVTMMTDEAKKKNRADENARKKAALQQAKSSRVDTDDTGDVNVEDTVPTSMLGYILQALRLEAFQ
jgi:hypothetical protein